MPSAAYSVKSWRPRLACWEAERRAGTVTAWGERTLYVIPPTTGAGTYPEALKPSGIGKRPSAAAQAALLFWVRRDAERRREGDGVWATAEVPLWSSGFCDTGLEKTEEVDPSPPACS